MGKLMRPREFAALHGVSPHVVRRWIRKELLKPAEITTGGHARFDGTEKLPPKSKRSGPKWSPGRPRRAGVWTECRDNGVLYVHQYDPESRHVRRESLETKDPVIAARRLWAFCLHGPRRERDEVDGVSASRVLDFYDQVHVEPNVVDKARQRDAIANLKAYFGDAPVRSIGIPECRAYADARRRGDIGGGRRRSDKRGADSTIRRELNALKAAANKAIKFGVLPPDQQPQFEMPAVPEPGGVRFLEKAQIRLMIETAEADVVALRSLVTAAERDLAAATGLGRRRASTQLKQARERLVVAEKLPAFILVAYYTAARRRSVERLTKPQIDLANGRINLHPSGEQRTNKRRPIVPIYPDIRAVIEKLMAESKTEYLFGELHSFYRPFVRLTERLGFRSHPHILRHSRATHLLQDGESPYKVSKILGDSLATVVRVYGHYEAGYLMTESGLMK